MYVQDSGMTSQTGLSAARRRFWHYVYERLGQHHTSPEWRFMNYGFRSIDRGNPPITLAQNDEQARPFIQLYHNILDGIIVHDRRVLEVGCGRGGGASYIARYLNPQAMVALDFSSEALKIFAPWYRYTDVQFVGGEAERLPFSAASFDVVVSVESSHCYASTSRFISESWRVLREGGTLAWADLGTPGFSSGVAEALVKNGFVITLARDITRNVLLALDTTSDEKKRIIRQRVRWLSRWLFSQFAGTKGSIVYRAMEIGVVRYRLFQARKPDSDERC